MIRIACMSRGIQKPKSTWANNRKAVLSRHGVISKLTGSKGGARLNGNLKMKTNLKDIEAFSV